MYVCIYLCMYLISINQSINTYINKSIINIYIFLSYYQRFLSGVFLSQKKYSKKCCTLLTHVLLYKRAMKGGEEMHNTNVEIIINLIVIILRNNQVDEKVIKKIIKAVYPNING